MCEGVKLQYEDLQHHIYVAEEVMEALDKVYTQHCRQNQALGLRMLCSCFNMMEDNDARVRFEKYFGDVEDKLPELSSTPQVKFLVDMGDPQAFALRSATPKLGPLFWLLQGRISLPLPTPSMLEDLQACLNIDTQIIIEVLPTSSTEYLWLIFPSIRFGGGLMALVNMYSPLKIIPPTSTLGPKWSD